MQSYTQTKLSMLVFASYMCFVGGIGFGFFPHCASSLIGLKTNDETYTRLFGLLASLIGINYFLMVQQSAIVFIKLSVLLRYVAALFMIYLVATGVSPFNLLLLAFGDIAAATWTFMAIRYDSRTTDKKST